MSEERKHSAGNESAPERPVGRDEVISAAIDAAADLFSNNNPSQVSVREIARRAGVSHALVHRYLGSKDDIFRAVLASEERKAQEFWSQVGDVAEAPSVFSGDGFASDRYLRILMRANVEGVHLEQEPSETPLAKRVLALLHEHPITVPADAPAYDPRVALLAVTTAMGALSLAHDFFIASVDLKGMDKDTFHAEFRRLMLHILSLADTSK